MKKLILFIILLIFSSQVKSQNNIYYSTDSSRIKYASFQEGSTRGLSSESFFNSFLRLPTQNSFYAVDTIYSPDSAYCYIKYAQSYSDMFVENSLTTLTWHNQQIIRFSGYYVPIEDISLSRTYTVEEAIQSYKTYYGISDDSCHFYTTLLIAEDTLSPSHAVLAYKIQSDYLSTFSKILYVNANNLSIIKETKTPGSGFNATLHTRYNGVREGNCLPISFEGDTLYILQDNNAAVNIFKRNKIPNSFTGVLDTYYESNSIWGFETDTLQYSNYILDAYWSACQYSTFMQENFNCPKEYFQRYLKQGQYVVADTFTSIFIALDDYYDHTCWKQIDFAAYRELPEKHPKNIIVIGTPTSSHNPKSSIDETVHEFAHIFSYQSWNPLDNPNSDCEDQALSEACADIWSAIITYKNYPMDSNRIWKIGEDIELPNSEYSCVRNIANPSDSTAEIQMNANNCGEISDNIYEQSGIFSHWFYLLTQGFSGIGCNGSCYNVPAIPMDSAAKLLYYCERCYFERDMTFSRICQATIDACEIFSNAAEIKSSVLRAWNVIGVHPFDNYGIERYGLSYTSLNNDNYTIDGNLIIDSSRTLTITGTLNISDTCSIIINPGSKLIVDGGTLTSACDGEMWPGIEIMGDRTKHQLSAYQGVVELKNGAVIENAYNALRTGYGENYWSTTGGIIRADSAFFRNNQRSVEILSYADTITSGTIRNNFSYFKKCTFIVDTNNLFGATGCTFYNHISMNDVKGIQITGCHFANAMSNLVTDRGGAIYTLDAGFSIKTACNNPANILIECSCPEYWATHNTFEGFSTAIDVNTSGNQYAITIDEAVFNNNITGISINGNNAATITRNTFNLSSIPYYTLSGTGLVLNSCTGFKVEGNNFYRAAYTANLNYKGISANNLGTAANNLYLNKFTNLNYGIYITGANGNRTTGLLCSCDTFNHNQFDILLNRSSSILPSQGSYSKGADNSFYLTESSSFQVLGIQRISYYYSIGGQHSPINPSSSITQYGTATANTCASTLCNNLVIPNRAGSSYTAMRNQYDSLLNVFEEQDYASVLDNADAVSGVYTTATLSAAQSTQAMLLSLGQSLYETSQTAVRQIMQDSILRLADLEDWHTAMPGISARYALAETQYQNGESNALTLHGIPTSFALTTAERDEYDNYLDFNTLKTSLTPVGWLNATDAQIAELQRIAELNTGRASEMAKGVLCFFFDICYDNTVEDNTTDEAPRYGNTGHQFETMSDDILVYPNPTTGQIEITTVKSELKIKDISVTDIYGKIIFTQFINDYFGTADLSSLTAGIYVLRATMEDGSVAVRKVMKQ